MNTADIQSRRMGRPARLLLPLLLAGIALSVLDAQQSYAQTITANITVDNRFGFGFGNANAITNYTLGQHKDSCKIYNQSQTFTIPASIGLNGYLYLVAWSDDKDLHGALAQFSVAGNDPIYSGIGDWEVYATGIDFDPSGIDIVPLPTNPPKNPPLNSGPFSINSQISLANANSGGPGSSVGWVGPSNGLHFGPVNVGSVWPSTVFPICNGVAGIDPKAQWMWYNSNNTSEPFGDLSPGGDGFNHQEYLIFRLPVSEVPGFSEGCSIYQDVDIKCAGREGDNVVYDYTFQVTNQNGFGAAAEYVQISPTQPGVTISSSTSTMTGDYLHLNPSLADGQQSGPITIQITADVALSGQFIDIEMQLHAGGDPTIGDFDFCCTVETITVQLPECPCFEGTMNTLCQQGDQFAQDYLTLTNLGPTEAHSVTVYSITPDVIVTNGPFSLNPPVAIGDDTPPLPIFVSAPAKSWPPFPWSVTAQLVVNMHGPVDPVTGEEEWCCEPDTLTHTFQFFPKEYCFSWFGGLVVNDLNGDGVLVPTEPGLEGWSVQLRRDGEVVGRAATDALGGFLFESVEAGTYELAVTDQEGWSQTVPDAEIRRVEIGEDTNEGVLFGFTQDSGTKNATSAEAHDVPTSFALQDNYPNPFNPSTSIAYDLPHAEHVRLAIYDALGREVEVLVNVQQAAGRFMVTFDAGRLPSGIYFYHFRAGRFDQTRKMLLMK